MDSFIETLEKYGASREKLRLLDTCHKEWELLPYATLVNARRHGNPDLTALSAVYEWQENPLIFLIDGELLENDQHFQCIRRTVAMRGDTPYLGVVRAGRLTVYRVALDQASQQDSQIKLDQHHTSLVFSRLINQRPGVAATKQAWISDVVLKLLREAISDLVDAKKEEEIPKEQEISQEDAISLAGRALFTRFLADRDLLTLPLMPGGETDPRRLFADPPRAEATSAWLDKVFNGDFLPLSPHLFSRLSEKTCQTLSHILYRAPGGQLHLEWQESWAYLDFAHIPVGVLSQAYEQHMRDHLSEKQRKEGSYYTPRIIVELMVSGAFHALRREEKAHAAKVLDPAVGAGVFLLAAYRHLVAKRWAHDNQRPDTRTLREILYQQIRGFDINEAALRFAALGLYLLAIELDPHPQPVEKLRFEKLRERVLFKLADGDPERPLGSLGPAVGDRHVGCYDLVIGNPPWPTGTKFPKQEWAEVRKIVTRIAKDRLPEETPPPPLPNEGLDLPFVWRAMEWARPGGQIALALHARLLFQQGEGTPEARRAVFSALDMTGLLNGTELRNSKVWPGISAPFCLLFAKNQPPSPAAAFRFVTPHIEKTLNDTGMLRIDTSNADLVTPDELFERPEIFKILFRGTRLDLEIFERMKSNNLKTVREYWISLFGQHRGHLKQAGNGYKRPYKDEEPISAPELTGLPDLTLTDTLPVFIDPSHFPVIEEGRLFSRPRSRILYTAPLLIVKKSSYTNVSRAKVSITVGDMAFNETYYGYSTAGHINSHVLARYFALLIGSKPAFWYILMSSGEFGFEREVVEKFIIDNIPLIPLEDLRSSSRDQIEPLFNALTQKDCEENWAKVDAWAAELFGLRKDDLQVIADTLKYNLPFAENKKAAQAPVKPDETERFCQVLETALTPWAEMAENTINVTPVKKFPARSPWAVVRLDTQHAVPQAADHWPEILRIADELGTSEVFWPDENNGGLWIARLNQARYWSQSQAELVARRIVWEHTDILAGENNSI